MNPFRLILALDTKLQSLLFGAVDWVDGVFPFPRKTALAVFISLYLFFLVWAFERKEVTILFLTIGIFAAAVYWAMYGVPSAHPLLFAFVRIGYVTSILIRVVLMFYGMMNWVEVISYALFAFVVYLDSDEDDGGHRKRWVDRFEDDFFEAPGLKTA